MHSHTPRVALKNKPAVSRAAGLAALLPLALALASCSTEPPSSNSAPLEPPAGGTAGTPSGSNAPNGQSASSGDRATSLFEKPRKADGEVFIQIVTNGISPFWDPMAAGMKKAAEEMGCKAEWSGPQNAEVAEQKRMVENALAKGADGIAISCIEAEASIPIIEECLSRNVPVITFDSDSSGSRRLCYIGTNNRNAGKAAGEAAAKLLPAGGKFVGFVGNISAENARERKEGFEETAKAGKIDLIETLDDNKDPARARRNVEDAIAKHSDIQGLLGLYSYNGPAIAQAVSSAGIRDKYKVVCFDAEPVTLQQLEKGNIDATVVQKPYDFGYFSTKLLYLINRKGWSEAAKELKIPDDGIYDTGVQVITPATVGQYKKDLEKLGVKSS